MNLIGAKKRLSTIFCLLAWIPCFQGCAGQQYSRAQCLPGYWGGNTTSGVNLLSISNPQGFKNLTPGTGEGLIPIPGGGEWIGQIQEKGDGNIPVMDVPMDAGDFIVEGGENGCRTIGGSGQYQCGLHFHIDPSEEHPHEVKLFLARNEEIDFRIQCSKDTSCNECSIVVSTTSVEFSAMAQKRAAAEQASRTEMQERDAKEMVRRAQIVEVQEELPPVCGSNIHIFFESQPPGTPPLPRPKTNCLYDLSDSIAFQKVPDGYLIMPYNPPGGGASLKPVLLMTDISLGENQLVGGYAQYSGDYSYQTTMGFEKHVLAFSRYKPPSKDESEINKNILEKGRLPLQHADINGLNSVFKVLCNSGVVNYPVAHAVVNADEWDKLRITDKRAIVSAVGKECGRMMNFIARDSNGFIDMSHFLASWDPAHGSMLPGIDQSPIQSSGGLFQSAANESFCDEWRELPANPLFSCKPAQ